MHAPPCSAGRRCVGGTLGLVGLTGTIQNAPAGLPRILKFETENRGDKRAGAVAEDEGTSSIGTRRQAPPEDEGTSSVGTRRQAPLGSASSARQARLGRAAGGSIRERDFSGGLIFVPAGVSGGAFRPGVLCAAPVASYIVTGATGALAQNDGP
jgi:hypothetical protein